MKIIGIIMILGALVAGAIILPEQISGYFKDGKLIEKRMAEAEAGLAKAEGAAPEEQVRLIDRANNSLDGVARMKAFRGERVQGIAIVGGCGLALIALGLFLVRRSIRAPAPTPPPAS